jgi:hypothetical protein
MPVGCNLIAYIDPMSGTILLQLLIAAVVGTGLFFRRALWRIVRLFPGRKAEPPESPEPPEPPEETELNESTGE